MTGISGIRRVPAMLAMLWLLALSGCSVQLPGTGAPPQLYVLTPKSTYPADLKPVEWQLLIELPTSPAGLDSPRIAVSYSPIELDYFARSNWTDRAPRMIQRLLVESFENSERIVAVGTDAVGLRSDFLLKTEIREFQAEYREGGGAGASPDSPGVSAAPVVRVRLGVKLVRMPRRVIAASASFEAVIPADSNTMQGIITSFDEALGDAMQDVVVWTLTEGESIIRADRR